MNLLNELAVGKTIEFEDGTQRIITEKLPHQDIKNAYYYKFNDGYIERDVRIHGKIVSNLVEPLVRLPDERLGILSDKVRSGIPIDFTEALEVIEYQELLKAKRQKSLWERIKYWWKWSA